MRVILSALALLIWMLPAQAEPSAPEQAIKERLERVNPALQVQSVAETPLPGVHEVLIGGQVFYFSADGRYLLQGELVDLASGRSLTEPRRQQVRLSALDELPEGSMLVYPAKGERKQTITVFTDIDCPYCRKLHEHMEEMNTLGLEVRYLAMPRTGVGSESYLKAVSVWCAEAPEEAMTRAKQGRSVAQASCENPVRSHLMLAQRLGVNATPTLITERGSLISGYMPPDALLERLRADQDGP